MYKLVKIQCYSERYREGVFQLSSCMGQSRKPSMENGICLGLDRLVGVRSLKEEENPNRERVF